MKIQWMRKALYVSSAAMALSIFGSGSMAVAAEKKSSSSKVMCKGETSLIGYSALMDHYYTDVISEQQAETKSEVQEDDSKESVKKAEQVAPEQTKDEINELHKQKYLKKFDKMGISIAYGYVRVRKKPTTKKSKVLGKLYRGCSAKILDTKGSWVKVSSGKVNGYIKKKYLAIGASGERLADKYGEKYIKVARGTITLNVRQKKSTKSTILTQIPEDEKYELKKEYNNWYRIDVGDGTKGYVAKEFCVKGVSFKHAVSIAEEKAKKARKRAAAAAQRKRLAALAAERNRAKKSSSSSSSSSTRSYSSSSTRNSSNSSTRSYSSSSTRSSSNSSSNNRLPSTSNSSGSNVGARVAAYAKNFLGNPYVWGGTSLTNGCDCSGFTMSLYAQFGYSLPHSSAAQSGYGRAVSLSALQPGDLIFYRNGSSIGHVTMYIGGGQVIHASNHRDGIKISSMGYRTPACARRIVG